MSEKILITGISGFIGRNVLKKILNKNREITAIVRPQTDRSRIKEFEDQIELIEIDLADIQQLKEYLEKNSFETIVHIGALRGGRKSTKKDFFNVNVNATEQFIINAYENKSKFIFCSSVGVFGGAPLELPANNSTPRVNDGYYHFTKIQAETLIQKYVLYGLKAAIIRPSITYGVGDYGFAFNLTKLVDKNLMHLSSKDVLMHLTNVELISNAILKLMETDFKSGVAYNIADKNPVKLRDLVCFINKELKGKSYSRKKIVPQELLLLGEKIARFLKNELWVNRFEFIAKDRYYDTIQAYKDLSLKPIETIPEFKVVINWYKSLK
ncbi:MAG: NAD(P)-dependent oxidoreductase [Candidatus Cloacimonetes bacterium]|nr:NAD(P)-dependent oxidoreductase [Candidatus Cloacimonadota bacterium]